MNISTPSEYLLRPLRTVEEAKAEIVRRQELSALSDAAIIEVQRAFWNAVHLAQPLPKYPKELTTAELIQQARMHNDWLWKHQNLTEEETAEAMLTFCRELCGRDELRAKFLASAAIGGDDA